MTNVFLINLPSPPKMNVFRDWAGGYGTALESKRIYPGHDPGFFEVSNIQFIYIAGMLRNSKFSFIYKNLQENEKFQNKAFYRTTSKRKS